MAAGDFATIMQKQTRRLTRNSKIEVFHSNPQEIVWKNTGLLIAVNSDLYMRKELPSVDHGGGGVTKRPHHSLRKAHGGLAASVSLLL